MRDSSGEDRPPFLSGGGEMGARLRAHDWTSSPLGAPAGWPAALRTAVGIMLNSRHPMYVAWGADLLFFHNDSYIPLLGAKHPAEPGQPFSRLWAEIWDDLRQLTERALAGEAIWFEDFHLSMTRNGVLEDTWFTFSFSPLRDEAGDVAGFLCACMETTGEVMTRRRLTLQLDLAERLRTLDTSGDIATVAAEMLGRHFKASRAGYAEIDRDGLGFTVENDWTDGRMPSLAGRSFPLDLLGGGVVGHLRTGLTLRIDDLAADPRTAGAVSAGIGARALLAVPLLKGGRLAAILYLHEPVPRAWTEADAELAAGVVERTWEAIERARAVGALNRQRAEEGDRLRRLFEQAPSFMAVLREPGHVYELANASYRRLVGDREIIGKPVRQAIPELEEQGIVRLLDQVYASGVPHVGRAVRLLLLRNPGDPTTNARGEERFVDFVLQPITRADGTVSGIFVDGNDVTDLVRARERAACLVELGDRLRDLNDTGAIAQAAAEVLGKALGVSRAGYGRVDAGGLKVSVERDWTDGRVASIAGTHEFRHYGSFIDTLHRGELLVMPDIAADPRTSGHADALRAIDVAAMVNVPVMEEGRFSAVLYIHDRAPRAWTGEELALIRDVADRTWSAAERARSEASLRLLNRTLEQQVAERTRDRDRMWRLSTDIMLVAGFDGRIVAVNPAWSTLLGWSEAELLSLSFLDLIHPDDRAATEGEAARLAKGLVTLRFENRYRHKDGSYRLISWTAVPDEARIHAVGRDMTAERDALDALRSTEEALRQSQKMEAVGQLTGGVAHDFNNLLQVILGNLDMLQDRLSDREDLLRPVRFAMQAGDKAATLTQRLLAFARRQPLAPVSLDLNALVGDMQELIRRSVGETIRVETVAAGGLWRTWADANQVENALLNLVINARDAMPDGGRLVIETANANLDGSYIATEFGLEPGEYVCLSVTDTGTGMPRDVVARAFEPFFTTKAFGQGTGLGLSQLYGFARQSGGHAAIYSEEGGGTTVKLYLPRHRGGAQSEAQSVAPAAPVLPEPKRARDGETILVLEDEGLVRMLLVQSLERQGYRVIEAHEPPAALAVLEADGKIDLLATDVGLPGMNGRQVAEIARRRRPDLPVLFLTGYAHDADLDESILGPRTQVLGKPFNARVLLARIRAMLEGAG
ncbi:PAS domain-containing protein [Skermanella rosea]|uniref:GAF domain-containing protein n=1 Tax=Skermanella rosea TaxID=1817965 RepID=UPI00193150A1|nr:GAF domain-containing protein [Skermanella rosea]UEM02582.1 PAS domain-containing protein [Skermanella rosea]